MNTDESKSSLSSFNAEKWTYWLLILFGFSLPFSVAINNFFAISIVLLWIYQKKYHETWNLLQNSNVLKATVALFLLHIIGLLWTEDIAWGLHMLKKEWILLLMPIFMSMVKKQYIRDYIGAFLLAMSISELTSYLIWFEVIPPILKATVYDPTPFIHHTSYNPLLAFTVYLTGYYIFFDHTLSKMQKYTFVFFFITMSINMFITGGRAGQVGYVVVVTLLMFQYFNKHLLRAFATSILLLSGVFYMAYTNSVIFCNRVDLVKTDINNFNINRNTSVGMRINFALNSFEIIKENPWIGVGTGDYVKEYTKVNMKNSPTVNIQHHPHNMYLLEMVLFGIVGLLSLLAIFFFQIRYAWLSKDAMQKKLGYALALLFMVISLSDSYLLGHFTSMLFVYFSAFIYRPFR